MTSFDDVIFVKLQCSCDARSKVFDQKAKQNYCTPFLGQMTLLSLSDKAFKSIREYGERIKKLKAGNIYDETKFFKIFK